jgi:hypothetical protein
MKREKPVDPAVHMRSAVPLKPAQQATVRDSEIRQFALGPKRIG